MRYLNLNDELFDVELDAVTMTVASAELVAGHVEVFVHARKAKELVLYEDIRKQISGSTLRVHRRGMPRVSAAQAQDPTLDLLTMRALNVVREVREYASAEGVSHCRAYNALRKAHDNRSKVGAGQGMPGEEALLGDFPSRATVYRYLARDIKGLPVILANANRGNRTPRYKDEVTNLVKTVCKQELLKPNSRWTIRDVTKMCNRRLHDDGVFKQHERMSNKYVRTVIYEQLSTDPEFDRTDPKLRAAQKSVAKGRLRVDGLLQRVEQDALHLPWCLRTEFGDARNVQIVHAICCATSIPLGFHIVIGSPRESDGLQCVETYLFSKEAWFKELGIQNGPDLYGSPVTIYFDNGPEAKGPRMGRLTQIGTAPVYLKSRSPQKKPYIERLNRSVKEELQTLQGSTRLDDEDGMRDPELLGDLPMPLPEFKRWLARFYFELWIDKPLERFVSSVFVDDRALGNTPRERFENMAYRDGYVYPLPPDPNKWRMVKYNQELRTLSRKSGISFADFRFRGDNLPWLITRFGETLVKVLVNPDDFRTVWVLDGEEMISLTNIDTDETTPAYTFQEAKAMMVEYGVSHEETEQSKQFRRDLFDRSSTKSAKDGRAVAKSAAEQAKQVAREARAHQAVVRARDNPMPPATTPAPVQADVSPADFIPLRVVDKKTGDGL